MKKIQIDKLIRECQVTKATTLNLTDLKIETIPNEVFELKHLKILCITRNSIKYIPYEIGELTNLEFLGLNYNLLE